jgi:hypothetical protein
MCCDNTTNILTNNPDRENGKLTKNMCSRKYVKLFIKLCVGRHQILKIHLYRAHH